MLAARLSFELRRLGWLGLGLGLGLEAGAGAGAGAGAVLTFPFCALFPPLPPLLPL